MFQPVIIRKPRFQITKKNHRFVGFKIGDEVFYGNGRGSLSIRYKVSCIDDCYDSCGGKKTNYPRSGYARYLWCSPVKKFKVGRRSAWSYKNVMDYNEKLWETGAIGHEVSYDELFHTVGEYYHWCMGYKL